VDVERQEDVERREDAERQVGAERPSIKTDLAYSLTTLGSTVIWSVLSGWLLYFYLPPEGEGVALVPAALYGGVMFVTRVANAALAPPIGHLSDRTRTRWGRRLPYMFASALPMLVFFVLLWTPPVQGNSIWNLVYVTLMLLLYNTAYGFNQITHTALLPEIAVTDRGRVRLSAWSASFFLIGMILGGLAGVLIERLGYAITALIYGAVTLPFFYLPFLFLRFYWGVTTLIQSVIPFIVTEICLLTKTDTLYFYLPALLASLACYPVVTHLANRFGKWAVFAGSLLAAAIVLPGLMLIGDWLPLSLQAQGMIWIGLEAIAMSGVTMLPPAFGAEITDYDETLTGQRREGTYYATWGLLDQVINGVAAALLPLLLLLGRSRSDPHGPLGVRIVGVVGGVLMLVAFLIFMRYPLRRREA
jgi:GPH family glycoside/pentoside/hexuronide:cation symporter